MPEDAPRNPVSDWMARSPVIATVVVLAAVLGFLIATTNGIYTIVEALSKHRHAPRVKLASITLMRQSKEVNTNAFLGLASDSPVDNVQSGYFDFDPVEEWPVPYLQAQVVFVNPTDEPVSFLDCALQIRFDGERGCHRSHAYVMAKSGNQPVPGGPIIHLAAREAKRHDLEFYFIPLPEIWDVWTSERRGGQLVIGCIDDRGNKTSTSARRIDATDVLK
jgi:hypothetical protein